MSRAPDPPPRTIRSPRGGRPPTPFEELDAELHAALRASLTPPILRIVRILNRHFTR
jgi:hypothetical protein